MEQRNLQDNSEVEIDLLEVLHILLDRFWIILLSGIAGGLVFIAATLLFITPQYESTTKMYVLSKQDNNTITNSDMQTSLSLTKDYAELIKSRTVTESVISKLDLELTHEELLNKMSINSATDTRILSISVRDKDPYVACEIADSVRDVAANHIKKVMDINAVNVVEKANIPEEKCSPSTAKNGMIGVLLGIIISVAIIMIVYITNDTIKTQEDVERYLQLSVLGTIPMDEKARKAKKKKQKRNTRGRR